MGVVYEATQLSLGRTVALKLLTTELSADPSLPRALPPRGALQAALDHPHIVTVYEAGELRRTASSSRCGWSAAPT